MKTKILVLIFVAFTGIISGCKKNEAMPNKNQLILGKWKIISELVEDFENGRLISSENYPYTDLFFYLTFKSDKTLKVEEEITTSDNEIYYTDYAISGDILTLFVDQEYKIVFLDKSTLKLQYESDRFVFDGKTYYEMITETYTKVQ